jgi:hypothetical protein
MTVSAILYLVVIFTFFCSGCNILSTNSDATDVEKPAASETLVEFVFIDTEL